MELPTTIEAAAGAEAEGAVVAAAGNTALGLLSLLLAAVAGLRVGLSQLHSLSLPLSSSSSSNFPSASTPARAPVRRAKREVAAAAGGCEVACSSERFWARNSSTLQTTHEETISVSQANSFPSLPVAMCCAVQFGHVRAGRRLLLRLRLRLRLRLLRLLLFGSMRLCMRL